MITDRYLFAGNLCPGGHKKSDERRKCAAFAALQEVKTMKRTAEVRKAGKRPKKSREKISFLVLENTFLELPDESIFSAAVEWRK